MIISDIEQNVTVLSVWKRGTSRTSAKRTTKKEQARRDELHDRNGNNDAGWTQLTLLKSCNCDAHECARERVIERRQAGKYESSYGNEFGVLAHRRSRQIYLWRSNTFDFQKNSRDCIYARSKSLHVIFIVPLSCPFTDDSFY